MPSDLLSDVKVRNAKPADKPYKLPDGAGLHLFVTKAGGRLWRYRYQIGGKEKLLSLGPYPSVSLADARQARDKAKALLREGRDPGVVKRQQKLLNGVEQATTFEAVAREWYELNKRKWAPNHASDVIGSLERDVFPKLGSRPIKEISATEVLSVLRQIEARPAIETAHRIRQRMSAVFVYAIASGRGETDPAAIVRGAMAPVIKRRQPAVTSLENARAMLLRVEGEPAHPVTKLAHRLLALTALRPGTLIQAPWAELDELDEDEPLWIVPAARMKLLLRHKGDEARDHLVPLPRQAVEVIEAVRTLSGKGPLVFPNTRHAHKPMSENAIGYLLNRAGYHHKHVPHGWRSTFSTLMNERFPHDRQVIDMMLAHTPKDKVESAYNRAEHLERRRELAQEWADLILEGAKPAEELLNGPRRSASQGEHPQLEVRA
jgi:integrase